MLRFANAKGALILPASASNALRPRPGGWPLRKNRTSSAANCSYAFLRLTVDVVLKKPFANSAADGGLATLPITDDLAVSTEYLLGCACPTPKSRTHRYCPEGCRTQIVKKSPNALGLSS